MAEDTPKTQPKSQRTDHGHCLCSAVRFTLTGEPLYNVICHCENCRRHGGSVFHCASIFLRTQYTLHTDPGVITEYTDLKTQSTHPLYRGFCSICGSKVCAKTPLNENIISVPAGVLDGGNSPSSSIIQSTTSSKTSTSISPWRPHKEQFLRDRQAWVPEFGELISQRFVLGPGGEEVSSLTTSNNVEERVERKGKI